MSERVRWWPSVRRSSLARWPSGGRQRGYRFPWVWANLLAHGSETLIAESISRPSRHQLLTRSWWIARSELADVVLDLTHWSSSLVELQESVLIPLELDLASSPEVSLWSHRRWVDAVTTALRHQNRTHRTS